MKVKLWLNIATFVALGLVIFFGWHDIEKAFHAMLRMNAWVLALMVPTQLFAFYAVAQVYYHFFKATHVKVSHKTLLPAVVELNFVNHIFPSGGISGFSYLPFRLKKAGISTAKSTLAQLARYVLTFVTFIGLLILALGLLALEDRASRVIIFIATALTFSILFITIIVGYVIGSERRIKSFTKNLAHFLNKIIHLFRRKHPETIRLNKVERTFHELHEDYMQVKKDFGRMKLAVLWAFISNIAEVTLIYIVFIAHDAWVNPGGVIIAYAVATIAGMLAILPGGLGVYEPLMAAVLLTAGVPAHIALSATLVSRVIALVLALGSGYVLYHVALKRYGKTTT